MADSNQELRNAIQAMNKAVAVQVVQKKRGELVPEDVVQRIVESNSIDEMVQFIDSTIVSENEQKITPPDDVDDSHESGFGEEYNPTSTGEVVEDSSSPPDASPLDVSSIQNEPKPARKESFESYPNNGGGKRTNEGKDRTVLPVVRKPDETTSPAPLAVVKPESNMDTQRQSCGNEDLDAEAEDTDIKGDDTRVGEFKTPMGKFGKVPTETVPVKEVSSDPADSPSRDDVSAADESVDKSKMRVRPIVLSAILFALLCVYVTLNLSEIEALLLQWYSTIENWVTNI